MIGGWGAGAIICGMTGAGAADAIICGGAYGVGIELTEYELYDEISGGSGGRMPNATDIIVAIRMKIWTKRTQMSFKSIRNCFQIR